MSGKADVEFLALLVHRGHVDRDVAEKLFAELQEGADLDQVLEYRIGWSADYIERMRRTRAGEIPEIPGYQILGKAGSGGTADVFRAREKKTQRTLALKVLRTDARRHRPTLEAFVKEAKLLAQLEHSGLVKGYGVAKVGKTASLYFSKMEFVDGRTLLELLDEGRSFDENTAYRIVLEVSDVLAYLADQGVIHRDVKPGNIMLSSSGQMKLIDLGFAGAPEEAPQDEETTVGTVQYLSPEQARGGAAADMRSDIYSLGITLFHLVVGRLPFESSDDQEVLRQQVEEALRAPELQGRGFSPYLSYFIQKMMAKDLDERYQSWDELREDIREQIEGRDSLDFQKGARSFTSRARTRRR